MGEKVGLGAVVLSVEALPAGYSAAQASTLRTTAPNQAWCCALNAGVALRSALPKGSPVFLQTMLTAISMSAIATNGVVPGKGVLETGSSEVKPFFSG